MKKVLAIYDHDPLYSSRLLKYICRTKDQSYLVLGYTNKESLSLYLQSNKIDTLLIEERRISDIGKTDKIGYIIVLSEERQDFVGDYPAIFKYQSAELILMELHRLTASKSEEETTIQTKDTIIYTIYSPSHESFHTAYSYVLADYLSQSIPTLFLDFSMFHSEASHQLEEPKVGLSELIFYMKQEDSLRERLQEIIVTKQQLSYIKGVKYAFDLLAISKNELRKLLQEVIALGRYKAIVINLSMFSDILSEIFSFQSSLLLITDNKVSDHYIVASFQNQIIDYFGEEISERMEVVQITEEEVEEFIERKVNVHQSLLWMRVKGRHSGRRSS